MCQCENLVKSKRILRELVYILSSSVTELDEDELMIIIYMYDSNKSFSPRQCLDVHWAEIILL